MGIQIFGTAKCFDTKKAERHFKERNIKYQFIDLYKYGLSKGEFSSVREEILFKNPKLYRTPIVRNGKQATVGYQPDVWKDWQ